MCRYISRSVAGSFDNEGVAIFAMVLTFYCFVKSVRKGSLLWSAFASLSYFYMSASWGGYVFIINLIPLYVIVMVCLHLSAFPTQFLTDSSQCKCAHENTTENA